jgi:hypothetical protein
MGGRWIAGSPTNMNPTDRKPSQGKKQAPDPPLSAEIGQILEDYANDLRKIIKKLRGHLN